MQNNSSFSEKLLRYEQLKRFETDIESELKTLGGEIAAKMVAQGADESPPLESGKIVLIRNKKWLYPKIILDLEQAADIAKSIAQSDGTATRIDGNPYIKYQKSS